MLVITHHSSLFLYHFTNLKITSESNMVLSTRSPMKPLYTMMMPRRFPRILAASIVLHLCLFTILRFSTLDVLSDANVVEKANRAPAAADDAVAPAAADDAATAADEENKKTMRKVEMNPTRRVVVPNMCRCSSGNLPVPHNASLHSTDTGIVQDGSLATGAMPKHFFMRKAGCECRKRQGEKTTDVYLKKMQGQYCGKTPSDSNMKWKAMPDFGVEEKLPLFLGVLSYKSPKSLNAALTNWEQTGLADQNLAGAFIQLNARSQEDDAVIQKHDSSFDFHVTGSPTENIHPGLAISRFCREAERSPRGHPNGENLMLFLEKDWHVAEAEPGFLTAMLDSVNMLLQRGVQYVRLSPMVKPAKSSNEEVKRAWQCDASGMAWDCTTAHNHRYTNLPSVIRCDWFLRYLEPFALVDDSIMFGCRRNFRQKRYIDWEEAMQDGRIAWTNSQWVIANTRKGMFSHVEVDQ
jgi:hypothetical protein